jgi:CDP-glucose 4,6-dehydratase
MEKINMQTALNSFSGKRVFVTGHTGFKGSWLVYLLKELGAVVMGYSLPVKQKRSHFNLLNLKDKITHVEGDIRNADLLNDSIKSFQPDFVIHLAAQALVKKSYEEPVTTFETNVMGSVNLLDSIRKTPSIRSLVYITSDKCYENSEWIWGYRENDKIGGRDPYSASKGAAEIIFSSYARSFFISQKKLGAATTRAGNVIGGGDWAIDRIIPDCVRAIEKKKDLILRNPDATRPWQHVLEPLSGYLLLAAQLYRKPDNFSGSWNFGPPSTEVCSVEQVANTIFRYLGYGSIKIKRSENQPHEAHLLQLNCDKSNQLLGWSARWDVKKTIEMTAEWYRVFLSGRDITSVTREQIYDYFPELS